MLTRHPEREIVSPLYRYNFPYSKCWGLPSDNPIPDEFCQPLTYGKLEILSSSRSMSILTSYEAVLCTSGIVGQSENNMQLKQCNDLFIQNKVKI